MPQATTENLPATGLDNQLDDPLDTQNPVDISKALKLRLENKLSYGQIAKQLNCPKSSVHYALKPFVKLIENPYQIAGYQDNKAVLLTALEMRLANEMLDDDKIKSASLNNVAYAFSQVSNQGHLARGESTSNVNFHVLNESVAETDSEIDRLERELSGN